LQQFPEYIGRNTWITGESYGGVYVPTLAELITSNSSSQLYKQFQGFMVGNPVFSCDTLTANNNAGYIIGSFNMIYWHGLVSYRNYANWTAHKCDDVKNAANHVCGAIFNISIEQIGNIDQELAVTNNTQPSFDPDDLYQDFCLGNGTLQFSLQDSWPSCVPIGKLLTEYLNQPEVQTIIGAVHLNWTICSSVLQYNVSGVSMNPYYLNIFQQKPSINVLVYSGDVDILTVPFAFTKVCLNELNQTRLTNWGPWFVNGATSGYWERFDHYTYATIKGAGHEVPEYQPLIGYELFSRFLTSQSLKSLTNEAPMPAIERPLTQGKVLRAMEMASQGHNNNNNN